MQRFAFPDDGAPVPKGLTGGQLISLWADLFDAGEALLRAGLRREIGPDGDLPAAHRKWLMNYREEQDRELAASFARRQGRHAG